MTRQFPHFYFFRPKSSALMVLIASFVFADALQADSYRCGRKVVKTGDKSSLLVKKCGQPRFKDRGYEQVKLADGRQKVRVERWYYQKSKRSQTRAVLIYRGTVVGID